MLRMTNRSHQGEEMNAIETGKVVRALLANSILAASDTARAGEHAANGDNRNLRGGILALSIGKTF